MVDFDGLVDGKSSLTIRAKRGSGGGGGWKCPSGAESPAGLQLSMHTKGEYRPRQDRGSKVPSGLRRHETQKSNKKDTTTSKWNR